MATNASNEQVKERMVFSKVRRGVGTLRKGEGGPPVVVYWRSGRHGRKVLSWHSIDGPGGEGALSGMRLTA